MQQNRLSTTIIAMCLIATVMLASVPWANCQSTTRQTGAYISVAPNVLGLGQTATVNIWVYPAPADYYFAWQYRYYENLTITFTRPDGTTDTFMPTDASGGHPPGETELIGAIWFYYKPNQVGTWKAQFTFSGQTFVAWNSTATAYYPPATSKVVTFTVQSSPVNAGILNGWPYAPLPTGYWTSPVNANNREWAQLTGDWLQGTYDWRASKFNPYSTAPGSSHIIWKQAVSQGGLIGGPWGSISYDDGGGTPPVIMNGKLYYNIPASGAFRCIDLRSGELIFQATGSISFGQNLRAEQRDPNTQTHETAAAGTAPYLWSTGSTWTRYDPFTGTAVNTITNVPPSLVSIFNEGDPVVYCVRQGTWNTSIPFRRAYNELIKWDLTKVTGNNWATGIVWNVSLKQPDGSGPGEGNRGSSPMLSGDGTVVAVATTGEDMLYAYNSDTGVQLWKKKFDFQMMGWYPIDENTFYAFDSAKSELSLIEIKTGNVDWTISIGDYPWGSQLGAFYKVVAYGNIYVGGYDGYLYCIGIADGKIKWKFSAGNTTETVFGTFPFYRGAAGADGKIYASTSEHTPSQPRFRFNKLFCIDAYTGKSIWTMSGSFTAAIAEGYLVGVNEYSGEMYCFGKGKTTATVTVQNDVITKGNSVLIKGTIMDQSPAQPNTPAVADESMDEWMDYLHMQNATLQNSPPNPKGVNIFLTATAPDGSSITIGNTMSDGYGSFGYLWMPPSTGLYKIQATFAGSQSYWSSTAETQLGVTTAPSASVTPPPTTTPSPTSPAPSTSPSTLPSPTTTPPVSPSPTVAPPPSGGAPPTAVYIAVAGIVAVIIVIVAVVLFLRRRAK